MYDFDKPIKRTNTDSIKWDHVDELEHGKELLPMWVADMDFEVAEEIRAAMYRRMEHPIYGYTMKSADTDAAFIRWCKRRYHWQIEPDWFLFSPGVVPTLAISLFAYSNPGDGVIIQTPVYPPFFDTIVKNNRKLICNPLLYTDGRYTIDFQNLEECMKDGAKLLVLCSPHNPVGRVWTEEELRGIHSLALKYGIFVVSDEIHADIVYSGFQHIPFSSLEESAAQNSLVALAPSKTFNIPGLQVSAVVIPNTSKREQFDKVRHALHLFIPNAIGITAFQAAYQYGEQWLNELLQYLEGNRDYIYDFVQNIAPELTVPAIEGTFLAWLDFRNLKVEHSEIERTVFEKAKLGLNNGIAFGKDEGTGFMRLNFGTQRKVLKKGLAQLGSALSS